MSTRMLLNCAAPGTPPPPDSEHATGILVDCMSTTPLPNYIRRHRKRAGLSQKETAFLLGGESGTTVSRHEGWRRTPTLDTALAYALVFGVSVDELFAGEVGAIEAAIRERAELLLERVAHEPMSPHKPRRYEVLFALVYSQEELPTIAL